MLHCRNLNPIKDSSNILGHHLVLTSRPAKSYETQRHLKVTGDRLKPLLLPLCKEKLGVCCVYRHGRIQRKPAPGDSDVMGAGAAYTWPSSWAMVKAVLSPLSSLMLQLLYGSQTVPNSARPGATTQVWANHSSETVWMPTHDREHSPKVSHLSLALQMSCLQW